MPTSSRLRAVFHTRLARIHWGRSLFLRATDRHPRLNTPRWERWTAYGFIYIAWSFTVFYWLGNAAKNRALSIGDNPLGESDWIGVLGFLPGLPSVFLVVILLAVGARAVLRAS